ncbi:MAG: alpha/beta hydrolase-fold protein [Devosia sp.]
MPIVSLPIDNPPASRSSETDEAAFAAACLVAAPLLGPDSVAQPGIPKGTLTTFRHVGVSAFPGVARDCWLYVPAQYKPAEPAHLMVFQDARFYLADDFNAPAVFDNLIARGEMPVTIGLFVEPGDLPGEAPNSRGNRSFEYDSVTDAYSRLLHDELLPIVERDYAISKNPDHRASTGMSSGGICAFNLAWERPDSFRRVVSHVGSFTNIRGGNAYPSLVRKTEPKPIRAFLQGAAHDLDNPNGSWSIANFDMAASLRFKGYDHRFEFGQGAHDRKHGAAIFPETMRWLWR